MFSVKKSLKTYFSFSIILKKSNLKILHLLTYLLNTGVLDELTLKQMAKDRCGREDLYVKVQRSKRYIHQGSDWSALFQETGKVSLFCIISCMLSFTFWNIIIESIDVVRTFVYLWKRAQTEEIQCKTSYCFVDCLLRREYLSTSHTYGAYRVAAKLLLEIANNFYDKL